MTAVSWPEVFKGGVLARRVANVLAALRLSRHRTASTDALKEISTRYFGRAVKPEDGKASIGELVAVKPNELPLRDQLNSLRMCLQNGAPGIAIAATRQP